MQGEKEMGGYSCQRKSSQTTCREAYGKFTLPTNWAAQCPDEDTQYNQNILPEFFFGFYQSVGSPGIDLGIRMTTNSKWRAFMWMSSGVGYSSQEAKGGVLTLNTSQLLYMRAWISKSGSSYYANLNISKTGYTNTDLMSSPLQHRLNDSWGNTTYNSGRQVNREISIAANPSNYETSGCYSLNGEWLDCGYVTVGGVTYVWTNANSAQHTANSQESFYPSSSNRLLRLRKDGASVNTNRIKVISASDSTTGAHEKVSIDFRSTPQI
jgi:hypothetical protein